MTCLILEYSPGCGSRRGPAPDGSRKSRKSSDVMKKVSEMMVPGCQVAIDRGSLHGRLSRFQDPVLSKIAHRQQRHLGVGVKS